MAKLVVLERGYQTALGGTVVRFTSSVVSRTALFIIVLTAAFAGHVDCQSIHGVVRGGAPSGRGVPDADITIASIKLRARTDADGRYRIESVAPGRYSIQIRAIGFAALEDTLTIGESADVSRDYVLQKSAALDTVVTTAAGRKYVSPALQGFEERRLKNSGGHFIADSVLRLQESSPLVNILKARISGYRTVVVRGGDYIVATHYGGSTRAIEENRQPLRTFDGPFPHECYVTVYTDGVLRYDMATAGEAPPPNLADFNPANLGGVEFYAADATMPEGFRSMSGCGALLLWTRER